MADAEKAGAGAARKNELKLAVVGAGGECGKGAWA
jgi:hypothetical protein